MTKKKHFTREDLMKWIHDDFSSGELMELLHDVATEISDRVILAENTTQLLTDQLAEEQQKTSKALEMAGVNPEVPETWDESSNFSRPNYDEKRLDLCQQDVIEVDRRNRTHIDLPGEVELGRGGIVGFDAFFENNRLPTRLRVSTGFVATAGEIMSDEERGLLQLEADDQITRVWLRPS